MNLGFIKMPVIKQKVVSLSGATSSVVKKDTGSRQRKPKMYLKNTNDLTPSLLTTD